MSKVLETRTMTLTGTPENDFIALGPQENLALIQARDASKAIRIATDPGRLKAGNYLTGRANCATLLTSFNFSNERIYIGAAGGGATLVIEYLVQLQP